MRGGAAGARDIIVDCDGVIPEQDYADLRAAGVAEIFGPGSNVLDAASIVEVMALEVASRRGTKSQVRGSVIDAPSSVCGRSRNARIRGRAA